MNIVDVSFQGSFEKLNQCPVHYLPEFAFVGRSNVGKSSLINMITNKKSIARTSSTPGKTQHLNFYLINKLWYLVDLPGYGYAKVSKKIKSAFPKMIEDYLINRPNLFCTFLLLDSRHPLQKKDEEMIEWFGMHHIPFVIVYTKIDKMKPTKKMEGIEAIQSKLLESWETLPKEFITSSDTREGKEELLVYLSELIDAYDPEY